MAPKTTFGDFTISLKKNETLRKFSGLTAEYEIWANKMVDHMCDGNPKWKPLLDKLKKCPDPIRRDWLSNQSIEGVNAWDL